MCIMTVKLSQITSYEPNGAPQNLSGPGDLVASWRLGTKWKHALILHTTHPRMLNQYSLVIYTMASTLLAERAGLPGLCEQCEPC